MYDGSANKKSGVLVLTFLTALDSNSFTAPHEGEKSVVYPDVRAWTSVNTRSEYERQCPSPPDRLIDNLLKPEAKISGAPWNRIENDAQKLQFLVDAAFEPLARVREYAGLAAFLRWAACTPKSDEDCIARNSVTIDLSALGAFDLRAREATPTREAEQRED